MSMQPGPYENLPRLLNDRLVTPDRIDEIAGGVFRYCAFIEFDGPGAGEWVIPVAFPIVFVEKPNFGFGGELRENSPIQNGRLPTVSGIVKDWQIVASPDTGRPQYKGATLLIVVTGVPQQQFTFHYTMEAHGLRAPAAPLGTVGPAGMTTGPPSSGPSVG
jgi:hypothetical protein